VAATTLAGEGSLVGWVRRGGVSSTGHGRCELENSEAELDAWILQNLAARGNCRAFGHGYGGSWKQTSSLI
jgi:hypothetical protein